MSSLLSRNRLLVVPVLLAMTLLLTACTPPLDVSVGQVVDRQTGAKVENATISITVVNSEGNELSSESCQNCQTLSEGLDWPTRGDRAIIQVNAPGYVPWEAVSPSSQAIPSTEMGTGFRVELIPLTELGTYQTELAAVIEQVEDLFAEAQHAHFPPEMLEQPLSEALVWLRQADKQLDDVTATSPPGSPAGD
jgi:hypothetical protein